METHWSLGVLIGIPVMSLILLALLGVGIFLLIHWNNDRSFGVIVLIVFVIVLGFTLLAFFPYKAEYHQWRTVEGTIQDIGSRQISDGKAMSTRYVFVIDGQPYGVDDTRASVAKKGDHVRLSCIKEWQWASVPGWACRWNQ
jgi:hypothetical protein